MSSRPIRVLVIDDSAVIRKMVTDALRTDPSIEVVGTAIDPFVARDKIKQFDPDVLTLDLEMPRMDGLTFLRIVMEQRPLPVIILSSVTQQGSTHALEALKLGAFDVLAKPTNSYSFNEIGPKLIASIKATVGARLPNLPIKPSAPPPPSARAPLPPASSRDLILLGASTGGTEALYEIITRLPAGLPGIAIVQHIPAVFSKAFADRLGKNSAFPVREAVDGEILKGGLALVSPGNAHMLLEWNGLNYQVRLSDGPEVWHQRPAVDMLFRSAAACGAAPHAYAGVLTGMGRDGAAGLLSLRENGATTFAQDEASSVVYGMPRAAWELGAAQRQIPLGEIANAIIQHRAVAAPGRVSTYIP